MNCKECESDLLVVIKQTTIDEYTVNAHGGLVFSQPSVEQELVHVRCGRDGEHQHGWTWAKAGNGRILIVSAE